LAVVTGTGSLWDLAGRRVGGGPIALVQRATPSGAPCLHGTCVLQKIAAERTPIDGSAPHELRFADDRSAIVRIVRHTLTSCGPEIVRFETVAIPGTSCEPRMESR